MSEYIRQPDGGVVYKGDPKDFSMEKADAVARGLELGSEPAPTGDPDAEVETAAVKRGRRTQPPLETGVSDGE